MKQIVLFLFALVCSFSVLAQETETYEYEPHFKQDDAIYARVGLSRPGLRANANHNIARITSYNFAFGYSRSLTYKGDVSLNGELGFSRQGFAFKDVTDPADPKEIRLHYVNIPVYLKYYPHPTIKSFYVGAGPQLGIRTSADMKTQGGGVLQISDEGLEDLDLSLIGVAGMHITRQLNMGVEVRYQHSFSKVITFMPEARQSVVQVSFFFPGEALLQFMQLFAYIPIF
ncbi:outer membrane beta-barrel protein [Rufibacter sp. LB8]|uniref:outer membrane beta-barrel protein n=1 Tax=Rufibacter sp. LB8 TaxID=2777781 RepID=UPI00178C1D4D|nr:outer membrane beta-barrel protein [Rufibacter sp. LB8]